MSVQQEQSSFKLLHMYTDWIINVNKWVVNAHKTREKYSSSLQTCPTNILMFNMCQKYIKNTLFHKNEGTVSYSGIVG